MREIKFRAWTGASMEYNVTVGRFGAFYVNPEAKGDGLNPNDSASLTSATTIYSDITPVMQYTGLKDMYGTEIYEGDIILELTGKAQSGEEAYPVAWDDVNARWDIAPKVLVPFKNNHPGTRCEVIGNIYENSDLVEVKS